jgi:ribulose-5-phosphate 4-epimerase/fuculose-1-phosphate aldolase
VTAPEADADVRAAIVRTGRLLHELGLAPGRSGNLSVRVDGGIVVTPTDRRLGDLDPDELATVALDGSHDGRSRPSKETPLHLAVYRSRPRSRAIVHLHSTHAVAVSCLADLDPERAIPPMTAYFLMRIGRVPLLPFYPPGSADLATAVGERAARHRALLLANHGTIVADVSLDAAATAAEELEEAARLFLLVGDRLRRSIPEADAANLERPGTDD